jgi:hypothetical protein
MVKKKSSTVYPYNYSVSMYQVIPQTLLDSGEKLRDSIFVLGTDPPHTIKIAFLLNSNI